MNDQKSSQSTPLRQGSAGRAVHSSQTDQTAIEPITPPAEESKAELKTETKPQPVEQQEEKAEESKPEGAEPQKETIAAPSPSSQPSKPSDSFSQEPTSPTTQKPTRDVKGAHWYVVHTYSGHEAKVATTLKQKVESQNLGDKILSILVPTQDKIEIKEGKKSTVKEKIFPGYLLIRMILDDDTWLAVRTTPGITSFVGIANKPTPIADQEVATIQKFMQMEAPKFKTTFSVGEAVKITDGPFSEFLGSISEIDEERGKIKVLVSIFGRETPVELDFLQVAKL